MSVNPAPSSAARIAPTWPSIIPLGATTWAPAAAWATAIEAYRGQRRVVVDRRRTAAAPRSARGRCTRPGTGRSSARCPTPTSAASRRSATWTIPSGSSAAEPRRVLRRRHAEQDQPADAGRRPPRTRPSPASRGCAARRPACDAIGAGSVDALLDEHRQDQVGRVQPHVRDEPAQRRGPPQPARPGGREAALTARSADVERRRAGSSSAAASRPRTPAWPPRTRPARRPACRPPRPRGSTSERSPNSRAVAAVCGPMQATTVRACGLPAMPTRLRTVEDEVKQTASKPPDLIASRISAGGGAARTVRYAVTSSISQPRSRSPAASVSVAMSARGSSTRSIGSSTSSYGGKSCSRPSEDCSPDGHQLRLDAERAHRVRGRLADAGDLHAGEGARVQPELVELLPHRAHRVGRGEHDPLVPAGDQALDRPLHLGRGARRLDRDGRHLDRHRAVRPQPLAHRAGLLLGPRDQHLPAVQRAVLPPGQPVALGDGRRRR